MSESSWEEDSGEKEDRRCDFKRLVLVCRSKKTRSGLQPIPFDFLAGWLDQRTLQVVWSTLEDKSKRQRAATWAYFVRRVLERMVEYTRCSGWRPSLNSTPSEDREHLRQVRAALFGEVNSLSFSYLNEAWGSFVALLPAFQMRGLFCGQKSDDEAISKLPGDRSSLGGKDTKNLYDEFAPTSSKHPPQSRQSDLLEPVPIGASNSDYLDEYADKLRVAIAAVRDAALDDLNSFVLKLAEGKRLVAGVNYAAIHASRMRGGHRQLIDPTNGCHFFRVDGGHPNLLANLIALCRYEMGPLTKPMTECESLELLGTASKHWRYVAQYGRPRLLPYLGLPTVYEALACVIVLLLEHPKFNVQSLLMGELTSGVGSTELVTTAGLEEETDGGLRITVEKWRALSQKTNVLTPLAEHAVRTYLEITEPLRNLLRNRGDTLLANQMWIGVGFTSHAVLHLGIKQLSQAFGTLSNRKNPRVDGSHESGLQQKQRPRFTFFERKPQLQRWSHITLKGLRVSSGIQKFVQTRDLDVAIEAFGHSNPMTVIRSYIPKALLEQIFERQHRRHQNLLITWASDDEEMLLKASDFPTLPELHEFLLSGLPEPPASNRKHMEASLNSLDEQLSKRKAAHSELVLVEDARTIAVLLVYREHLRSAPPAFLERPDPVTNLQPKFWAEFADAISGPLPPAQFQIREAVDLAKLMVPTISGSITFGDFWK